MTEQRRALMIDIDSVIPNLALMKASAVIKRGGYGIIQRA